MTRRFWLEPAGYLRGGQNVGNWRMSAYRVRGEADSPQILIAEDGATGRWGILREVEMRWSGDFATVEDALASLQDELGDEAGEGHFE
jgi:hypothetical protein